MRNKATDNPKIHDLTFPMIEYGAKEKPWDLKPLLYLSGAKTNTRQFSKLLIEGQFGEPLIERFALIAQLHEDMASYIINGGSRFSIRNRIIALRYFVKWVDEYKLSLTIKTVASLFIDWAESLLSANRTGNGLSEGAMYDRVMMVSSMLDHILERQYSLIKATRIRKPRNKCKTNKKNLQPSTSFGYFLVDICESLTQEAILGSIPVCIKFRDSQLYNHWGRFCRRKQGPILHKNTSTIPSLGTNDILRTHSAIINLRIEAELLIFIAQTGMNLQQAYLLKIEQFHYRSYMDGYQVRSYKNRRLGEVLFEIFTNYKVWFEKYITWRKKIFPDDTDELMFPLIRTMGRNINKAPQFTAIQRLCKELNQSIIRPRALRRNRTNWLLRESSDPSLVAEMAQHTTEMLIREYIDPNPQIAIQEISRFHQQMEAAFAAPAPGVCILPMPAPISYDVSITPDCIGAAGCLFCLNHRDIQSQDHIWSLSSFRYLKSLELSRYRLPENVTLDLAQNPVLLTIERLTEKLQFISNRDKYFKMWVDEAQARINEGNYHPAWDGYIQLIEISGN